MSESSPVGTTISASANLTAPLGVIALDNDIEEVEREREREKLYRPVLTVAYTLHVSAHACVHKNTKAYSALIIY